MKRRILTLLLTLVMVLSLLPGTALAVNDSSAPAVTYAAAGGSHNGHKFAVIYREVHAVKGAGDIRLCTVILFQVDSL